MHTRFRTDPGFQALTRCKAERCLLVTVRDAAFGQVVRRHLQSHAIARQYSNTVAAELACQMSKYSAFLIQLDAEQAAGKFLNYRSRDFNAVFFAHSPPVPQGNYIPQSARRVP